MRLFTTLEIDELATEVAVDFTIQFGEPVIDRITNQETGDAICPDLFSERVQNDLLNECDEYAADYAAEKGWDF